MKAMIPLRWLLVFVVIGTGSSLRCDAGMPSVLPTSWTADSRTDANGVDSSSSAADARWQSFSFFIACLLFCAWGVKGIWNYLRKDLTWLPPIGYRRALGLVILWGLLFVIVLTMISGARELMTPGAWKKQGWTYKLADAGPVDENSSRDQAFEQLRFALWNYAATHEGRLPSEIDHSIDQRLWEIPGWGGTRYLYIAGQTVDPSGRLLVFEPELDGRPRRVILTNGVLGTMRTPDLERLVAGDAAR